MNNLLKSQIHENCKLALPEGLKELMSDMSREVLRAQPQNLYQFIANYLGALLEARETLTIACQVCTDICKCTCDPIKPELYNELKKIGLDEKDLENAIEIIEKHLKGDHQASESVKEQNLLSKLIRKTSISETQLPAIQQAIQKAFKRQSLGQADLMDFGNESNKQTSEAVHHTLQLHNQNIPKLQNETEEIFVSPHFKPCVNTDSSTSLAGSYVQLPKFRPYSAHNYEIMSTISEKEHLYIDYTKVVTTTGIKPKTIEISGETTVNKEIDKKHNSIAFFIDDNCRNEDNSNGSLSFVDYAEAATSTGLKENNIKICEEINIEEIKETDNDTVVLDDYSNSMQDKEFSDDEVQESIENIESENESIISSIADDIDV